MLDVTKNDIILYSVVVACREWRKRGRQFFFRGREPRLTVHCCRLRSDMPKATTIAFLLAAVGTSLVAHSSSALAQSQPCRSIEYERYAYTICEVDLHKHTARLYWKRSDGTPYAYLSALPRTLDGEVGRLLFATNAGMFDPALKPVGASMWNGGASLCT